MFSWGEDFQQGFRSKNRSAGDDVKFLDPGFHITDLSAEHNALAFIKSSGEAFLIRTDEGKNGERATRKQKYVKYREKIKAVSSGDASVTLLSESGIVLCVDTAHIPFNPQTPNGLCGISVSQVACGSEHSVALTEDGQVYTWGQDSRGQLGLGRKKLGATSPQHLQSLSAMPLVQIAAGGEQSFALSVSGAVFGWGRNDCGQLGLGDTEDRRTPTSVCYLNTKKTVHISCGKDHTATLTKGGAVFTFGSGKYGQLGHNSLSDELRPRLVAELWGAKVAEIACGRHHTLVLTESKRVYSFGCDEQGQLGRGEETHPSVPLCVNLPHDTTNGLTIRNIYAGGNSSFATCTSIQTVHKKSTSDSVSNATQHSIEDVIDKWASTHDSRSFKKIKQEIHETFSSASILNRCFLDQRKDKHFQTSPKYSGLDLSRAQTAFEKLVGKHDVLAEIQAAVMQLLPDLEEEPVGVEGLRIFLVLNELLHVTQRCSWGQTDRELAEKVADAIQRLSAESRQVIDDWWSSLPPSTMVKHVKVWKQALSSILSFQPVPRNSGVTKVLLVLQYMYDANNRIAGHRRIPEKTFGLEMSQTFLQEDLWLWHSLKNVDPNDQPLILCNYPPLLHLKSKKMAFDINAARTKSGPDCFALRLKRVSLLEDTFKQLASVPQTVLKKPLWVFLDEDPDPTDVYKRDFFHSVFHDMVLPTFGMFMFNDSKTLAWFPSNTTEEDKKRFFLFGVLCGLALYNCSIIYLPFPLALFKKLLSVEPTLEDMMEFSPGVGNYLQDILDYEDSVLNNLFMNFLINWDGAEADLDPQTPGKPLTSQNKKEFVDAYVNHVFNTSVEGVFKEFKRGFFQVCDESLVKLFRPEELQEVLVGQDVFDWETLKRNTVYFWTYHIGHPVIQMFWEVFDELTEDQKKNFIWFLTGYRKVPILGMGQIQMKVQVKQVLSGSHDQHFPKSLTCHSILELPLYSTKEIMQDRLTEALTPVKGFLR